MPNPQVTQKDIATASVTPQPRTFDEVRGKSREARVFFFFTSANVPVGMPHALARTPTQWRVAKVSAVTGAPGVIYTPATYGTTANPIDAAYSLSKNWIVLACETGDTWAEIIVS